MTNNQNSLNHFTFLTLQLIIFFINLLEDSPNANFELTIEDSSYLSFDAFKIILSNFITGNQF